jgi:hypothetical protein
VLDKATNGLLDVIKEARYMVLNPVTSPSKFLIKKNYPL